MANKYIASSYVTQLLDLDPVTYPTAPAPAPTMKALLDLPPG